MKRTRLTFNNRAEWLEARDEGIGASEVATIVGLNPFETPYQLWRRKLGIDDAKQENFAMKAGHYLEDAVSKFWSDATGNEIIKSSVDDFMFIDANKPFLRVSPDRTYWLKGLPHNDDNKAILECKTTQRTIDVDDIPKHWFCQVQMNLGVAGYSNGSLAWLSSGREFGYKDLNFVPDFYGWLVDEVERFWVDNIQGKKEPDFTSVTDILLKYDKHTEGKVIECDDDTFSSYIELKQIREKIAELEERKAVLECSIKTMLADAESLSYGGQTLVTWKSPKPTMKFDDKLFKELDPDMYSRYMVERKPARRFVLK